MNSLRRWPGLMVRTRVTRRPDAGPTHRTEQISPASEDVHTLAPSQAKVARLAPDEHSHETHGIGYVTYEAG